MKNEKGFFSRRVARWKVKKGKHAGLNATKYFVDVTNKFGRDHITYVWRDSEGHVKDYTKIYFNKEYKKNKK